MQSGFILRSEPEAYDRWAHGMLSDQKNFLLPDQCRVYYIFTENISHLNYVMNALIMGILPSLIPYKWKGKRFLYPFSALFVLIFSAGHFTADFYFMEKGIGNVERRG